MKRTIRRNVFETNSSSTHTLCISNVRPNADYSLVKMYIRLGEFGWELEEYRDCCSIASYVYTGAVYCEDDELINLIKELLPNCEFEQPSEDSYSYIDHGNELVELFCDFKNNPEKLLNFIFGSKSFIVTGNDNTEEEIEYVIPKDCEIYYKGN